MERVYTKRIRLKKGHIKETDESTSSLPAGNRDDMWLSQLKSGCCLCSKALGLVERNDRGQGSGVRGLLILRPGQLACGLQGGALKRRQICENGA